MPMDKNRYPANWGDISQEIRARAGNRCEVCGADNHRPHPVTGAKVILTVAHLDVILPDGRHVSRSDTMICTPHNLMAMCQRCHLNYDRKDNLNRRWRNRRRYDNPLPLFISEDKSE